MGEVKLLCGATGPDHAKLAQKQNFFLPYAGNTSNPQICTITSGALDVARQEDGKWRRGQHRADVITLEGEVVLMLRKRVRIWRSIYLTIRLLRRGCRVSRISCRFGASRPLAQARDSAADDPGFDLRRCSRSGRRIARVGRADGRGGGRINNDTIRELQRMLLQQATTSTTTSRSLRLVPSS
jgi:hypothetical protein